MSTAGVDQLLYLLDQAFEGDEEHSLLANLRSLTADDWHRRTGAMTRSIRQIAYHAGVAGHLYADHLFGSATATYEGVLRSAPSTRDETERGVAIAWMREGHRAMHDGVAALSDTDLGVPCRSHWGEIMERRRLIATVIHHNVYHAGEINHARALLQSDDGWPSGAVS